MASDHDRASFLVTADMAVVEIDGKIEQVAAPFIEVNHRGEIAAVHRSDPRFSSLIVHDLGHHLLLPGLVNAHSHAFQRGIRGLTGRRAQGDPSSFWSWRDAMYREANRLDPDEVQEACRRCFSEMLDSGITCVGEFHYLHHQLQGHPYLDPNELSLRVIAAAREVGIRLALLEVYYARAGANLPPLPEQRRFCDANVDGFLARVDELRPEAVDDLLWIGLAPHSVRAVGLDDLREIASYANTYQLPIHAHVSEQPQENRRCRLEHNKTPTQVFAEAGCLDRGGAFTAVHAIHIQEADLRLLAAHNVCACPTTEADLGDGIVPATRYRGAGTSLCLGSDSNATIDLIQEARLLEMHERLSLGARLCLADPSGEVAPTLLEAATRAGARALGRPDLGVLSQGSPFDAIAVDLDHPMLRHVPRDRALDALLLSGNAAAISQTWVGGKRLR